MTEQRARGIILRRRNVGEADRLYSILTFGKGKVLAKARGVRKVTSRQSGHLEPFYVTTFQLVSTHGAGIIAQALVEESFLGIHSDLEKIGLASRFAELIDVLTEEHQPVPSVYELLYATLHIIEQIHPDDLPQLFPRIFELKLMAGLGYQPELDQCVVGEEKYGSIHSYQFSVNLGGLVCPDHQSRYPGVPISREAIEAMRHIVQAPLPELVRLQITPKIQNELDEIIRRFLEYHLDPKLKSPRVAKELRR